MERDTEALEQCYRATSFQRLLPFLGKFYAVTPRTVCESEYGPTPPPSPPPCPPSSREEVHPTTQVKSSPSRKLRKDPGARSHHRSGRLEVGSQGGRTSGRVKRGSTFNSGASEYLEKLWTPEEDDLLHYLVSTEHPCELGWSEVAHHFEGRSEDNVKERWTTCHKDPELERPPAMQPSGASHSNSQPVSGYKAPWTSEEEDTLCRLMLGSTHATMDYDAAALLFERRSAGAVEKRCSALAAHSAEFPDWHTFRARKQVVDRPRSAPKTNWTQREDDLLKALVGGEERILPTRAKILQVQFPGRTSTAISRHWRDLRRALEARKGVRFVVPENSPPASP